MRKLLIPLITILSYFPAQSQVIDIGLNFGASFYNGDLAPSDFRQMLQMTKPAVGIFCRLANSQQFSTRINLNYASVFGDDILHGREAYRQLAFETKIVEFNVIGEWHSIRIRHSEYSATFPYLYGGIGVFHFNPKREVDGELIELQPLGTEGQGLSGYESPYNRTQFNLPIGMGIKFVVRNVTFGFEAGGRYLFTDYLDDVSGTEVNHRDVFIGNSPLAAELSNPILGGDEGINQDYRRGSNADDWYYIMNITLSYNFGKSIHKLLSNPVPCFNF
ncbi:MAG: DUF6089 family protein [Chitinophagales bacterium]|nr:DUF6089 family protein [Chitinophagales bacterium]